ncbi:hypothetical protein OAK92_01705 [Crocinitomicaceae bacterium]|nr:hypothetical protein [Crocinitomicaceae bacterium]
MNVSTTSNISRQEHNTITIDRDVVGCGSVFESTLAANTGNGDGGGGIGVSDEVFEVSHNGDPFKIE